MLSVIIPNYNHAEYLGGALDSVLAQSLPPDEIIVVDDGSTDRSVEIIEEYRRRDRRIVLLKNDCNRGVCYSVRRGIEASRGDLLYGLAADDLVLPEFFLQSLDLLKHFPEAGLCCSDPVSFDAKTLVRSPNSLRWAFAPSYFPPEEFAGLIRGGAIAGHTTIFRKDAYYRCGGYRDNLRWHSDWFLWLAIGFRQGVCYLPGSYAAIRSDPNSYSSAGRSDWAQQRVVLGELFQLIKSDEYKDIRPAFIRSGVLRAYSDEIVRLLSEKIDTLDAVDLALGLAPCMMWAMNLSGTPAPVIAKRLEAGVHVGVRALLDGKFNLARAVFSSVTEVFPDLVQGHLGLGEALYGCGQHQLAQAAFERAAKIDPNDPLLQDRLAYYRDRASLK